MKGILFVTCLGDTFYPGAVRAAVRVLERSGMEVRCPPDQTCCGQPMFNAGYFDRSAGVARRFLKVFGDTEDPIIAPSSSCAAMVRVHYPRLFRDDPKALEVARCIGERTYEFCEFLVNHLEVNLAEMGARFEESVTYHHSCHFRGLASGNDPVDLIEQIPDIRYIPLKEMDTCCGFGGTFSLNLPHVSGNMTARKLQCILDTGADWLVFADPGCALNITGYAHRIGKPVKAMHIAELIHKALGGSP